MLWLASGAVLGLWGRRKAIHTVERHVPPRVIDAVAGTVREFLDDVARAQEESRRAANRATALDTDGVVKDPSSQVKGNRSE